MLYSTHYWNLNYAVAQNETTCLNPISFCLLLSKRFLYIVAKQCKQNNEQKQIHCLLCLNERASDSMREENMHWIRSDCVIVPYRLNSQYFITWVLRFTENKPGKEKWTSKTRKIWCLWQLRLVIQIPSLVMKVNVCNSLQNHGVKGWRHDST